MSHSRFINNKGEGKKFKKIKTEVSERGKINQITSVEEDDVSRGHTGLAPLDTRTLLSLDPGKWPRMCRQHTTSGSCRGAGACLLPYA